MHILAELFGVPCDADKGLDKQTEMVVLGMLLAYSIPRRIFTVFVDTAKVIKWSQQLQDILESGQCSAGLAGKLAGRLSHAVTQAADRAGRAFI